MIGNSRSRLIALLAASGTIGADTDRSRISLGDARTGGLG